MLAAQQGDKHALAALLVRHRPLLLALCRRMLADEHLVQDAEQEACLRALLGVGELRRPDRFGAWLGGIGLNVCRELLRERARLFPLSWTSSEQALAREPIADEPGPAELAEAADTARRVRRAVAELPAGQRAAVTRFYLADQSQLEVAVDLGIGVGAVKTRLHKARARLRTRLREEMAMPEDDTFVPMRLAEVRCGTPSHDDSRKPYVLVLEEVDGTRVLGIWVGETEALAMVYQTGGGRGSRPLSFQFTAALLSAAGVALREVRVARLDGKVFYAEAVLTDGSRVDGRPSDALVLAVVTGVPIRVAGSVLTAVDAIWDKGFPNTRQGYALAFPSRLRVPGDAATTPDEATPAAE